MLYLDSSAIVKLVVPEPETGALLDFVRSDPQVVCSILGRVEVLRAARRVGARPAVVDRAESILKRIALVRVEEGILTTASELRRLELRTLDAIHVATALFLGPALSALVTYDDRLASAAQAEDLSIRAPR